MTELLLDRNNAINELDKTNVDEEFESIVSQLENPEDLLPLQEIEKIINTPMLKPGGTMDQGYKHD